VCVLLLLILMRYLDFLAVVVGSVFDGSSNSVGIGEGLGLVLAIDLIGPVGSRDGHFVQVWDVNEE
jgi:hypothetical protein